MTTLEFGNRLLELLRDNLGWGSRVTAGHLSLQVELGDDVFEIYYTQLLSRSMREAAARARGWVVLADHPRTENESDTSYWKRIWKMMPESQRHSPAGAIAEIGTYEARPDNVLMTKEQFAELLEASDLETKTSEDKEDKGGKEEDHG